MGGSGGGSAGKVEFPPHITATHKDWLDKDSTDFISHSMTDLMNNAIGSSPYLGLFPYDPDTDLAAVLDAATSFKNLVGLLSSGTGLNTIMSTLLDDSRIVAEANAFQDQIDDVVVDTLSRFESGMRDINAVVSSAFVIGRATIETTGLKEVAKYLTSLRGSWYNQTVPLLVDMKLKYEQLLTAAITEVRRIKIVSKGEEVARGAELDALDARWDLETYQYGANLMAAPGGGTMVPHRGGNKTMSTIGGVFSGMSAGGQMGGATGNPYAAIAGVLGGGILGGLGSSGAFDD